MRQLDRRQSFRRTRRTALGVGCALLLSIGATARSGAQDASFNNGVGSATAIGYKVNPTNGNLSFGITFGESIAGHQNTAATGQSRAINTGVIGLTLAGEGCDGGDPSLAAEDQPQPVIARSGEEGAAEGKTETEQPGGIEKFARATTAPFAEAITTIAPFGDPGSLFIGGGRAIAHSGVINGNTREALARTEIGSLSLGGGIVKLENLTWQAVHRTGAVNETLGFFNIGSIVIADLDTGGLPLGDLLGTGVDSLAELNVLLELVGVKITPPSVREAQGIVFVDPMKVGITGSPETVGPLVSALQPVRAGLTEALIEQDCGNASYITIADIALGTVSGAGKLGLELGGVQASTSDFDQFQFGSFPTLSPLPPTDLGPVAVGGSPGDLSEIPGASPLPAATAADTPTENTEQAQPVAGVSGDRFGLMGLIALGGLLLLAATAEGDRRKMRRAQRMIPLEV